MRSDKLALLWPLPSVGGGQPLIAMQGSSRQQGQLQPPSPTCSRRKKFRAGSIRRMNRHAAESRVLDIRTPHFPVPCCTTMKVQRSTRSFLRCVDHADVVSRTQPFFGSQDRPICTGHLLCPTARIVRIVNEIDRAQREGSSVPPSPKSQTLPLEQSDADGRRPSVRSAGLPPSLRLFA